MKPTNLTLLNITIFLKSQSYLLPIMLLFYIQNGLTTADFFFFQGIVCFVEHSQSRLKRFYFLIHCLQGNK